MDLKHKTSVDTHIEEVDERSNRPLTSPNQTKCCTGCQTTRTPLWRGGPAGPKSLCNACGIKYNKKRRSKINGFDKTKTKTKTSKNAKQDGDLLKMRVMVIDQKQQQQQHQQQHKRKRSSYERGKPWWNKLREEEQAAILLMAISCGGSLC